jgi:hypothetical protein
VGSETIEKLPLAATEISSLQAPSICTELARHLDEERIAPGETVKVEKSRWVCGRCLSNEEHGDSTGSEFVSRSFNGIDRLPRHLGINGRKNLGAGGGLAVFAQGITPFSPSMAAREARLRPFGPADAH